MMIIKVQLEVHGYLTSTSTIRRSLSHWQLELQSDFILHFEPTSSTWPVGWHVGGYIPSYMAAYKEFGM